MTTINFDSSVHVFDGNKTFSVSERDVKFDTSYLLKSPKGGERKFEFSHSTGPEFEATTKWIYKSEDGFMLELCNDAKMVKEAARAYLIAKTKRY